MTSREDFASKRRRSFEVKRGPTWRRAKLGRMNTETTLRTPNFTSPVSETLGQPQTGES